MKLYHVHTQSLQSQKIRLKSKILLLGITFVKERRSFRFLKQLSTFLELEAVVEENLVAAPVLQLRRVLATLITKVGRLQIRT